MPEAIAAPPTAAPAAPPAAPSPNAAPARPAAPAPAKPAAARTPATPPSKPAPAAPAKVENPFDKANADLAKFADPDEDEPRPPGAEKAPPKPAKVAKPAEDAPGEEDQPEGEEKPAETPEGEAKPAPEEKPGKTSPWKLVESYKKQNAALQAEIAEFRTSMKPGELPKEHQEKFAAIEARNKELEDEIRHVNYSKSKEFVELYQQPYEDAWASAISDLKELTIANDDGTSRAATAHDLIALANMPLGEARRTAKLWFGDSADDVMSHRRTIVELSAKQTKALDESKTKGGEREQQRTAEQQAKQKARSEENAKVWKAVNDAAVAKYEYLRPVEGETERNEKLEKAQTFVDETMKRSVSQAKTAEERDQILRNHAAVRNRAIGFSVFKHENVSLKAKLAELEKALAEFQGSEPTAGGLQNQPGGEGGGDEMGAAMNRMTKYVT